VRPNSPSKNLGQRPGELFSVSFHHEVEIPKSVGEDEVPRCASNQIDPEAESLRYLLDGFQEPVVYPPGPIFEALYLMDTQGN
jgi:hypothetical protein